MEESDLKIPGYSNAVVRSLGSSSIVYAADDDRHGRRVAIKVLVERTLDATVRESFDRELSTMGRLGDHPNIVAVHDSGFTDDGLPYFVMPLFPNGSFADRVAEQGALRWVEVADVAIRILSALETAHRQNTLHRDIKPANLFVGPFRNQAMLGDFGISTLLGTDRTATNAVAYTLHYVAPEVLDGKKQSHLSDIYSLGATLYQLLAGRPPFAADTTSGTIQKILTADLPDPSNNAPDALNALIATMLARQPDNRPASAFEAAEAAQRIQRAANVDPTPVLVNGPDAVAPTRQPSREASDVAPPQGSSPSDYSSSSDAQTTPKPGDTDSLNSGPLPPALSSELLTNPEFPPLPGTDTGKPQTQPTYGQPQPPPHPTYGQPQPTYSQPQPTYSQPQPPHHPTYSQSHAAVQPTSNRTIALLASLGAATVVVMVAALAFITLRDSGDKAEEEAKTSVQPAAADQTTTTQAETSVADTDFNALFRELDGIRTKAYAEHNPDAIREVTNNAFVIAATQENSDLSLPPVDRSQATYVIDHVTVFDIGDENHVTLRVEDTFEGTSILKDNQGNVLEETTRENPKATFLVSVERIEGDTWKIAEDVEAPRSLPATLSALSTDQSENHNGTNISMHSFTSAEGGCIVVKAPDASNFATCVLDEWNPEARAEWFGQYYSDPGGRFEVFASRATSPSQFEMSYSGQSPQLVNQGSEQSASLIVTDLGVLTTGSVQGLSDGEVTDLDFNETRLFWEQYRDGTLELEE